MAAPGPGLRDQARWRGVLRIGGPVLLAVGLLLTAVALVDFFSSFGTFAMPHNVWMAFLGIPLVAIGWAMTQVGYLGPATRYVAGEVTPTLRDTFRTLGFGPGAPQVCPACGARNALDARFCDDCGTALSRSCTACGAENAGDATFCKQCGAELEATAGS